jgi:hypothetical protein
MKTQSAPFKSYWKTSYLLIIAALLFVAHPAQAQYKFQAGLSFMLGFPKGEFKDNVNATGIGGGGEFAYSPKSIPLAIGSSFGYMVYGRERRREPFSTTIPDVTVEVVTTNNILLGHIFLRVQNKKGMLQPYMDGLVGFNYLFTDTEIKNINRSDDGEIASSTNLDDGVFSYGIGGGLMMKVYTGNVFKDSTRTDKKGQRKKFSLLIDLRMRYIIGGEAEYLKKGSIRRENGKVSYDIIKSKTDLLTAQIGVAFEF